MTTIYREIPIDAPAEHVWEAVRDVGRPHERIVPGVLTGSTFDGEVRTVTFADGLVVRERIVAVDEARQRVAYTVLDGVFEHHHASMEVRPRGEGAVLVWTTDVLPDAVADHVGGLVEAGAAAMQATLGRAATGAGATLTP